VSFFNGHTYKNGKFILPAPTEPFGHLKLRDAVRKLTHTETAELAALHGVETHLAIDTVTLQNLVIGILTDLWFRQMGRTPSARSKKELETQLRDHAALVQRLNRGEEVMAKKAKATKAKTPKAEAKPLTYKVFTSKVTESKQAKKFANEETKNHDAVIVQVLAKSGESKLDAIVAGVKATGRYKTNDDLTASVKYHLRQLVSAGLVAAREA
jgi:DNA uptake protein ComE-like DNA-binding protein